MLALQTKGVCRPAGEHVHFAQRDQEKRLGKSMPHLFEDAQRLLQKRKALGSSPQQRVCVAQTPPVARDKERQVPFASHCQPALQQADRAAQLSPGGEEIGETPAGDR